MRLHWTWYLMKCRGNYFLTLRRGQYVWFWGIGLIYFCSLIISAEKSSVELVGIAILDTVFTNFQFRVTYDIARISFARIESKFEKCLCHWDSKNRTWCIVITIVHQLISIMEYIEWAKGGTLICFKKFLVVYAFPWMLTFSLFL